MKNEITLLSDILSLAFKFGLLLGGAIIVFYGWSIGYLPKNISLSDGLLLTSLAIMFGLVYFFFILSITSLGIVLRPLWHWLQNLGITLAWKYKRLRKQKLIYQPFTIEKCSTPIILCAFPGVIFLIGVASRSWLSFAQLIFCTWGCAFLWSLHQNNTRKINSMLVLDDNAINDQARLKRLKLSQYIILIILFALPLLYSGMTRIIIDGVMRLSNFRINSADIHIKKPYVQFANEHGLLGEPSAFGENFRKFKDVKVLLYRVGTDVVIESSVTSDTKITLIIPSDHTYIINNNNN